MKKIINGKVYNTETAKELAYFENTPYQNDFNYFKETLYQKKTGEFFLYGDGNANSKYRQLCGQNCWSGGWAIFPMTEDEAKEWAEKSLEADEYETIFGEVEEEFESTDDIKTLRVKANLTQKEFAEFLGIPKRSIENWEGGQRNAPTYLIDLIKYKLSNEKMFPNE